MMNGLESNKIVFDDCDITNLKDPDYDRIKRAVETRGILIIPKQDTNPIHFSKIISKIWGIDNYRFMAWNPDGSSAKTGLESLMNKQMPNPNPGDYWGDDNFRENPDYQDTFNWPAHKQYPVQRVTGEKRNDKWTGIFQLGKLDWHCNLNQLHGADGVALQAIRGAENTPTLFMNTIPALYEMPDKLRKKIEGRYATYIYDYEKWGKVMSKEQHMVFKLAGKKPFKLWLIQENAGGTKGIYWHKYNHMQINDDPGHKLRDELEEYLFQPRYIYQHDWEVGDVIIMDQLLTQHKRVPEKDEVLEQRVLHRLSFRLTNRGNPRALAIANNIE